MPVRLRALPRPRPADRGRQPAGRRVLALYASPGPAAATAPASHPAAARSKPIMVGPASSSALAAATAPAPEAEEPIVVVENLVKYYPIYGGILRRKIGDVKAVDGVSFEINRGEVFGLVGESGCGKSTLGRTLVRLIPPTSGNATLNGEDIFNRSGKDLKRFRREMQIIFQDPVGSLNPRMPVSEIIGEGLLAQADKENGWGNRKTRDKRVGDYLQAVGLRRDYARRYPHEFSGGQRQRIGIAR